MVKFITKQTGGFIGSNAFSMGIGPAKVVWGESISNHYPYIVGASHQKHLIYVEVISKEYLQYFPKYIKYEDKKSELSYGVNIYVLSLQNIIDVVSPYIVVAGHPQSKKIK